MTTKGDDNPSRTEAKLLAIRQGAEKVLTGGKTVPYKGQSLDANGLLALVDGYLGPIQKVRSDRATLNADLATRRTNAPDVAEFVRLLKASVEVSFGVNSEEFTAFGFTQKKATPLTADQKVHKLAQLRATRQARGTTGPKARLAVRGVVSSGGGNAGTPATPPPGTAPGTNGGNTAKP